MMEEEKQNKKKGKKRKKNVEMNKKVTLGRENLEEIRIRGTEMERKGNASEYIIWKFSSTTRYNRASIFLLKKYKRQIADISLLTLPSETK